MSYAGKSVLEIDKIIHGDCLVALKALPDDCFDLIFTSPPYADNRKNTYKGVPIKHYVEWFLPSPGKLEGAKPFQNPFSPLSFVRKRREHYAKLKLLISTETTKLEIASKTILIV